MRALLVVALAIVAVGAAVPIAPAHAICPPADLEDIARAGGEGDWDPLGELTAAAGAVIGIGSPGRPGGGGEAPGGRMRASDLLLAVALAAALASLLVPGMADHRRRSSLRSPCAPSTGRPSCAASASPAAGGGRRATTSATSSCWRA